MQSASWSRHVRRRVGRPAGCRPALPTRIAGVEIFYTGLLAAIAVLIAWFAVYVVYRLLHEDK